MKILGIGVDMVKISRIYDILHKNYHKRFLTKILHKQEFKYFSTLQDEDYQAQYVASRWAAKEATVKAIGKKQLVFSETLITKDLEGKPFLVLEGKDNQNLIDELKITKIHISITHQEEYAVAYALAQAKI